MGVINNNPTLSKGKINLYEIYLKYMIQSSVFGEGEKKMKSRKRKGDVLQNKYRL